MPIVARKNPTAAPVRPVNRPDIVARPRVRRPAAPVAPIEEVLASAAATETPVPAASPEPRKPSGTYDVGYGKPPRHSQFQKGQSGNRRGRPKGAKGLKTLVRELLTEKVKVRTSTGIKSMSRMQAMLHKITEQALSGNLRALQQLVTLYGASVPDEAVPVPGLAASAALPSSAAEVDRHDLAILDGLKAIMAAEIRSQP